MVDIVTAGAGDAARIAAMAVALTEEISTVCGFRQFDLDVDGTTVLCRDLLAEGRYQVLLAFQGSTPVGFAGLSEGRALAWRSTGVGAALLHAVRQLAQDAGWRRLEVCTPPLPAFARSLAFYERHGFEVTGGRKMKLVTA